MKLVLQRALGDCGIAALATLLELPYEDVFVEAAKVDTKRRGRNGIYLAGLITMAKRLGARLVLSRENAYAEDEGLLVVTWAKGSRHDVGTPHLVACGHGVLVDPADGVVLPPDEYFAREKATAGSFLELH